jgi:hypothetical protein
MFPKTDRLAVAGQIDECALDSCQQPIYAGEMVWKHGCDVYCCLKHLAANLGAEHVSAEDK